MLSRCSKLFYIILSKYFYFASRSQASPQHSSCKQACLALHSVCTDIALRSCTAFACSALSHIARYAPSHRTNNYGTISQFKCKNNSEHLFMENKFASNVANLLYGFRVASHQVKARQICAPICPIAEWFEPVRWLRPECVPHAIFQRAGYA